SGLLLSISRYLAIIASLPVENTDNTNCGQMSETRCRHFGGPATHCGIPTRWGWCATFYTTGMEHSPTGAGTGWERTPGHAPAGRLNPPEQWRNIALSKANATAIAERPRNEVRGGDSQLDSPFQNASVCLLHRDRHALLPVSPAAFGRS